MKINKLSENLEVIKPIELSENAKAAIADYRNFANISEDVKITEDNLDEWALNEAAVKNCVQSYDLKHALFEDTTIDQAARALEAEKALADTKNQVDKVLDRSLKIAKRKQANGDTSDFPNVLLIGDAGFAKTDMVRQWAAKNGINLVEKDLKTMDPSSLGGIIARDTEDPKYATRLGTNELLKSFEKPNTVLFLDEYNRAKHEIRGSMLTLIQNHRIWDPHAEGESKFLPNFLFTVAAINPPNAAYKTKDLDAAEKSRFYNYPVQPDPLEHLKYLEKVYTSEIEKAKRSNDEELMYEFMGKLELARKILNDQKFSYDSSKDVEENADNPSYKPLNYRSFKLALDFSDGTKSDFLDVWSHYCNPKKKSVIEDILGDWVEVKDRATDAISGGSASSIFTKEKTAREKLRDKFGLNV